MIGPGYGGDALEQMDDRGPGLLGWKAPAMGFMLADDGFVHDRARGSAMIASHEEARPDEARRALVLHDRPLVVDLITLTLNHGVFMVRAASDLAEADAIMAEWRPHIAIVDMDHDDSTALLGRLGASTPCGTALRRPWD